MCELRDGVMVVTTTLGPGDSVWIAPRTWHGNVNTSDQPTRFETITVPGVASGYLRDAGVPIDSEDAVAPTTPPGPDQTRGVAERWGIEYWSGPVDYPVIGS